MLVAIFILSIRNYTVYADELNRGIAMESKKLSQHENLLGTNSLVVRQSRFESQGALYAEVNGKKFGITNFSLFGLAIQSDEEVELNSYVENLNLYCAGKNVATLSFLVKRTKKSDHGWELGLEVVNNTLPLVSIMRLKDFSTVIGALEEKSNYYENLPIQFKLVLLELCNRLESFEKYVKGFLDLEFTNNRDFFESKDALVAVVSSQIKAELDNALVKMVDSFKNEKSEDYKAAFSYFRDNLGKYMFQSSFTKRSYEKPRGYAGDYLMMAQIYENAGHAQSLFGSCMENAIQQFGEPSAVRNRSGYLNRKIVSKVKNTAGDLVFLSVACGPAEEVRLTVAQLDQKDLDRCTFVLLDQDEAALQYAQKTILEYALSINKKVKLKLINRGIKEVLVAGLGEQQFHMIYSAGLFDYFTDVVASRACKTLFKNLADKGDLIIGNFNVETTNWFGMLAFFDWSLILRGEADFKRLFTFDNNKISIESEDNNINLFCCISR